MPPRRKSSVFPSRRTFATLLVIAALITTPFATSVFLQSGAYSSFNANRPQGLDIVGNNANGFAAINPTAELDQGTTGTLVTIENTLNFSQDITIALDSTTTWALGNGFDTQTKTASPGQTVTFEVTIDSSANTGTHNYDITTVNSNTPSAYTFSQTQALQINAATTGVTVASDGSGDYTTISNAVTNTADGTAITVKNTGNGFYNETVTINSDRTITAEDGVCMDGGDTGNAFTIPKESTAAPTFDGFCIKNYQHAYDFNKTAGSWTIKNTDLYSHEQHGLNAYNSTGSFTIDSMYVNASTQANLALALNKGDFTMKNVYSTYSKNQDGIDSRGMVSAFTATNITSNNNAISGWDIRGTRKAWDATDITLNNNGVAGMDGDSVGQERNGFLADPTNVQYDNFTMTDVTANGNAEQGLRFPSTDADFTVTNAQLDNNNRGFGAFSANGNYTLRKVSATGNTQAGAYIPGSTNVTIEDSTFSNNGKGMDIDARSSTSASYMLQNLTIRNNGGPGIGGGNGNEADEIFINETTITGNTGPGIYFVRATVPYRITYTNISNNGAFGINAQGTTASWDIDYVKITNNGDFGVKGYNTNDQAWSIQNSILTGNTDYDLTDNTGVFQPSGPIDDATQNWWGQSSGPQSSQLLGASNMDTSNYLTSEPANAGDPTPP